MSDFKWPKDKRLAMSIVVNVEEGSEYSVKEGDKGMEPVDELQVHLKKPMRNYGNESNYQYGINEGAPRIIKLLDKYQMPATWTAAALSLERAPQIAAAIWDAVQGTNEPMVIVPYALDSNDMKMWVAPSLTPDAWLKYAIDTFDVLYEEGAEQPRMMSLGLHLRIIGRPGRIGALEAFLRYVSEKPGVWFTTRQQIAETFQEQVPAASYVAKDKVGATS